MNRKLLETITRSDSNWINNLGKCVSKLLKPKKKYRGKELVKRLMGGIK